MKIIPAIDLLDGKVVRLFQGKKELSTVYSKDPVSVAQQWIDAGADLLHIVDLSASFGDKDNTEIISKIAGLGVDIEVGGGIRYTDTADKLIDSGVSRIILGTKAMDSKFLTSLLEKYKDKVAVSVDAQNGKVMTHGWQSSTELDYLVFIKDLVSKGVKWIVYTDISKDGTLEGPSIEQMKKMGFILGTHFILSGGVGTLEDLRLVQKELPFVYGAIVGKSLYEKTLDLKQAIALFK